MKYRCRNCKKEFDLVGWQEAITNYYPQVQFPQTYENPNTIVYTNYSTSDTTRVPICPFCKSLEIEEIADNRAKRKVK